MTHKTPNLLLIPWLKKKPDQGPTSRPGLPDYQEVRSLY